MTDYFRPIVQTDATRPKGAKLLAGGWTWFRDVEVMRRNGPSEIIHVSDLPAHALNRLTAPRAPISGMAMDHPQIMGILNVTPDSFSDGGAFLDPNAALAQARAMEAAGASIIDVGGESTRPGAVEVDVDQEVMRTVPAIKAIRTGNNVPISIDTRKSVVAKAALDAGANLINDVAAFTFDPRLTDLAASSQVPVCLMHAQGAPETMQDDPNYVNVALDVFDFLEERVSLVEAAGLPRGQIIVDPGIGFGKTLQHNVTLIQQLSLYHSLGCPILLGASRKRFIGTLTGAEVAQDRMPGSIAVALWGIGQGVQFLRVHDVEGTSQAIRLQLALMGKQGL